MKRDYEIDQNNEINEKLWNFRLFHYFRFFRNLFLSYGKSRPYSALASATSTCAQKR